MKPDWKRQGSLAEECRERTPGKAKRMETGTVRSVDGDSAGGDPAGTKLSRPVCSRLALARMLQCFFLCSALLHLQSGFAATNYVWQDSPSPTPPYTDWTTAAHTLQDAVDAATEGDEIVVTTDEYQGPGFNQFIPWLAQSGLPTDGSADFTDPDGDSLNNWQEWRCGTSPTNALSVLRLLTPSAAGTNVNVTWQSMSPRMYFLERSTNLAAIPGFTLLATNVPGQAGATTYTHTNAGGTGPLFYRVGGQGP